MIHLHAPLDATSNTMDVRILPLKNISHAFLMARTPPTLWSVWNMHQQLLDKKKLQHENIKTPP